MLNLFVRATLQPHVMLCMIMYENQIQCRPLEQEISKFETIFSTSCVSRQTMNNLLPLQMWTKAQGRCSLVYTNNIHIKVFTELALWADLVSKLQYLSNVCLCVRVCLCHRIKIFFKGHLPSASLNWIVQLKIKLGPTQNQVELGNVAV